MTEPGSPQRRRSRRVAITAAGTGAAVVAAAAFWGPTNTIASFVDNVWAGAGFGTGSFGIESSVADDDDAYANHSENDPLELHVGTPISLMPGEVSYASVYLRRTARGPTDNFAVVSISGPTGADQSWDSLWNEHITFVARTAPAVETSTCNRSALTSDSAAWTDLYDSGRLATPRRSVDQEGNETTFTIGPLVEDDSVFNGDPHIICFEFTLSENVDTGANGQSVYPKWIFTAESQQQRQP